MDELNRLIRAWVCLRCKPKLQFYSKEEWDAHYALVHPTKDKKAPNDASDYSGPPLDFSGS